MTRTNTRYNAVLGKALLRGRQRVIHGREVRIAIFGLEGHEQMLLLVSVEDKTYLRLIAEGLDMFRVWLIRREVTPAILQRHVEEVPVFELCLEFRIEDVCE